MQVLVANTLYGHRLLVELAAISQRDVEVVASTASGRIAAELCEQLQPDVAIIEPGLPVIGGYELVPLIRLLAPLTHIVMWGEDPGVEPVDGTLPSDARAAEVVELLDAMDGGLTRRVV